MNNRLEIMLKRYFKVPEARVVNKGSRFIYHCEPIPVLPMGSPFPVASNLQTFEMKLLKVPHEGGWYKVYAAAVPGKYVAYYRSRAPNGAVVAVPLLRPVAAKAAQSGK
jgi:hypothetical protein